jgi:acetyl esterase/lipase
MRQLAHGFPMPDFGHRAKFGNDPRKHIDFSAVTHVAAEKVIPPFLILHIAGHPDVTAQARRLADELQNAKVPVTVFAAPDTSHRLINENLGTPDDPATKALWDFLEPLLAKSAD